MEATLRNVTAGAGKLCNYSILLWPTALYAAAEMRSALLIGNKDYKAGVGTLTNPLNDIRIVGEALNSSLQPRGLFFELYGATRRKLVVG